MTSELGVIIELDVPVKMRDGTVLRANVFRPDAPGRFPGLLTRTPYRKAGGGYERLVNAGYVVACQDIRGRYASDGTFVPFMDPRTQDGEDGYDTIEWLARHPACNGRVGSFGVSYDAWVQWKAAALQPPHLQAMCACSIPTEIQPLDWPGAFRPGRRAIWLMSTIAPDLRRRRAMPPPHTTDEARRIWHELEHGRWLHLIPWSRLPDYLPPELAEPLREWLKHPAEPVWKFNELYKRIAVPNLDFSGWFDHCNDSMHHLAGMQEHGASEAARHGSRMVLGPWAHTTLGLRKCGPVDFGPAAEVDRIGWMLQWFDHWLKDQHASMQDRPPVSYFVMGSGQWRTAVSWPPQDTRARELYLQSGFGLAGTPCHDADTPDTYTYDPRDPVPTLWQPSLFTGATDRRLLDHRSDILRYRTPPLETDITIAGYPQVVLFASSSARDTDFFARLIDEDPGGMALEVCYGMVRARHRNSLQQEELLVPGQVAKFHIRLGATANCFKTGHRIRLEITSSDFPNYDRNHNIGRNDLEDVEMVPARQKVHHSAAAPSRLVLPCP